MFVSCQKFKKKDWALLVLAIRPVTKKNKKLQRVLSGVKFQASSASTSALTGMEVELQLMAATNSSWPVTDPGIGGQSPSKKKTRALRDRPAQCSGLCEHHTHPHVRTRASTGTHTAFLSTPTYISQAHARPYARLCAHTHTHTHTHKHTRTATCAVHSSAFSLIPPSPACYAAQGSSNVKRQMRASTWVRRKGTQPQGRPVPRL